MNKKKLGTGLLALALVGVVGIGGSLAWFTDTESKTNTFATGKVDITLEETGEAGDPAIEEGIRYIDVLPGDTRTKKVVVHNVGDAAYVRVKVTIGGLDEEHAKSLVFVDNEDHEITNINYIANNDGTYSFYITRENPMEANDVSGEYIAFKEVKIPNTWGNEMVAKQFTIDVEAQAVQADNNVGFDGLTDADIVSVD